MKVLKGISVVTKYSLIMMIMISVTFAANVDADSVQDKVPTITTGEYIYIVVMSSWGALAALFQRFAEGKVYRWQFVVARDITNATLAALLVFLVCHYKDVSPPLTAVFSTLAAYGGARFMEAIYLKFISTVKIDMHHKDKPHHRPNSERFESAHTTTSEGSDYPREKSSESFKED